MEVKTDKLDFMKVNNSQPSKDTLGNEKTSHRLGKNIFKYFLIKNLYSKCVKNSHNTIIRHKTPMKMGKRLEQTFQLNKVHRWQICT